MADEKDESAVEVLPYDAEAPLIFEEINDFLRDLVPFPIEVEHVGSTAVPGLGGKGIIDILIITEKEKMRKIIELLESRGFKFKPEVGFGTFPERLFISGQYRNDKRDLHTHFHITFSGSNEHKDKLLFRDYLRGHPEEAKTYYELKKRWSAEAGPDMRTFTELKTPYISEVMEKAKKELGDAAQ